MTRSPTCTPKTEATLAYFFLRRLAVFFAAFLAFLFFAIAALLATFEWRCRNSAVANRRALHSDYTSAMKKTPTPLNGTCTRAQHASAFAPIMSHDDHARDVNARIVARYRAKKTRM
jgi:hypothetical protein